MRICDSIRQIENGYVVGPTTSYACGTILTYKCDAGYEMMGTRDLVCTNKGYFTPELPRCVQPGLIFFAFPSGKLKICWVKGKTHSGMCQKSCKYTFRPMSGICTPTLFKNRRCWSLCCWPYIDNHLWSMLHRWWEDEVFIRRTVEPHSTVSLWVNTTTSLHHDLQLIVQIKYLVYVYPQVLEYHVVQPQIYPMVSQTHHSVWCVETVWASPVMKTLS